MNLIRAAALSIGLIASTTGLAREIDTVLVVSIDALHPDALTEEVAPTLHGLMGAGHFTLQGRSVDPPMTLIAHTAMLTGLSPQVSGKRDNQWQPGMPGVAHPTFLDDAKQRGFATAYFYAKPKLGYLVSAGVDEHALAPEDGVERARAFLRGPGRRFVFLHISGLEYVGTRSGWLSPEYLDELSMIDLALAPLLADVRQRGAHVLVVTSDHAGHDRLHGTSHPEDYKVPLIVLTGPEDRPIAPPTAYEVTALRGILGRLLVDAGPPPPAK
jgi:predicted AlkP superfamily pyrophosphatase or phosphodiesterase